MNVNTKRRVWKTIFGGFFNERGKKIAGGAKEFLS
jgi:hypothetical protein